MLTREEHQSTKLAGNMPDLSSTTSTLDLDPLL